MPYFPVIILAVFRNMKVKNDSGFIYGS